MITSYARGHKTIYINNEWVYADTKRSVLNERPCKKCGEMPTQKGYDACLGFIPGVVSACCGHGKRKQWII